MRKFTNTEISEIRANLNNGVVYCGICNGRGVGQITVSPNGLYIRWQHYGQSANKNTDEELRWLLETIFESCETVTPAEYSKYHVNYVPIDKAYKGIDMSYMHPNIYGL
jgi:hypothetical protein